MYEYKAKITSVYDGDTITGDIDCGFGVWLHKAKMRLLGVDTAEIRGGTAATKEKAYAARDYVRSVVLDQEVIVCTAKKGKYGRWLVTVWLIDDNGHKQAESLNEALIRLGHAVRYMTSPPVC